MEAYEIFNRLNTVITQHFALSILTLLTCIAIASVIGLSKREIKDQPTSLEKLALRLLLAQYLAHFPLVRVLEWFKRRKK